MHWFNGKQNALSKRLQEGQQDGVVVSSYVPCMAQKQSTLTPDRSGNKDVKGEEYDCQKGYTSCRANSTSRTKIVIQKR